MTTALEPTTYPVPTEAELESAEILADWLGEVPGRNEISRQLMISSKKASAIWHRLRGTDPGSVSAPPAVDYDVDTAAWPMYAPRPPEPAPAAPQVVERALEPEPIPDPESTPVPVVEATPAPKVKRPRSWPLAILALPASVAVWSGWVGLGAATGFGIVHPLPGIVDSFTINTAITLPIGVEAYAAYAIRIWLSTQVSKRIRRFAMYSALGALILGAAGQIAYHLMAASGITKAPDRVTMGVACIPVVVVACGTALAHMVHNDQGE